MALSDNSSREISPFPVGVLLAQLGTPDDATPRAVKKYLREFLSDRRVIEANRASWWLILNGIILNTRPQRSSQLYRRLIDEYGPVLRTYSASLSEKIMTQLSASCPMLVVRHGMRYGNPSLRNTLREMITRDRCDRVLLVPLYPQYSASTTGSTCDAVFELMRSLRFMPALRVMPPYHARHEYLDASARLVREALSQRDSPPERVIFSYHGLPESYVIKGDPYASMCLQTTAELMARIDFPADRILHTYQSRFGREPWLAPHTDETLIRLAGEGIRDVVVNFPGFSMDCLETLDEMGVENSRCFRAHGGQRLQLVSCLNDHDFWVEGLAAMIKNELGGWI